MNILENGDQMYEWCKKLFPIMRSLTGEGNILTLKFLKNHLNELEISSYRSNKTVFDWKIPPVWIFKGAYIKTMSDQKIIDSDDNNLHVMSYSDSIDRVVDLKELNEHLFSVPEKPTAIPYVTSYYKREWGFSITDRQRLALKDEHYRVRINSKFRRGRMHFGEALVKGESSKEVIFSTYICHPQMANNELSGPVIVTALMNYIKSKYPNPKYSYRALFLPETIGSISYLSKNYNRLKSRVIAGWVVTCVGDEGNFSYIPSRYGNNLADKISIKVLKANKETKDFKEFTYLSRGSDERQFCSPLIDLPFASITKSKYGEYNEYHTSLDDLNFISSKGLWESLEVYKKVVDNLESNPRYMNTVSCEPFLQKYDLYPSISFKDKSGNSREILNVLAYCDGTNTLDEISEICQLKLNQVNQIVEVLLSNKLICA